MILDFLRSIFRRPAADSHYFVLDDRYGIVVTESDEVRALEKATALARRLGQPVRIIDARSGREREIAP